MDPLDENKGPRPTSEDEVTQKILRASKALWPPEAADLPQGTARALPPAKPRRASSPPTPKPKQQRTTTRRSSRGKTTATAPEFNPTGSAGSMSSKAETLAPQKTTSLAFRRIMREVTLVPGESESDYLELAAQVEADLQPNTSMEFIFVSRFTQIQWDLRRVHNWKDRLRRASATEAFVVLMESQLKKLDEPARAALWHNGQPDTDTKKLMRKAGLTKSDVVAGGLAKNLALFETLEIMEARLEMRGHTMLHELQRHRQTHQPYDLRLIEGTAKR